MVGNKISGFFEGVKDKFNSFIQKQTDVKVLKTDTKEISKSIRDRNRKRKIKTSRWSKLSWIKQILSITSSKLSKEESIYLAKHWFGNFSGIKPFQFKRGSRTPKTVFKRGKEKYSIV